MLPNPLIPGFNPDPSVVRVGDDYYVCTSTFEYLPGLPIYHSKDMIHWETIGHVVTTEHQLASANIPTNGGAWAPTIRHHDGVFYVVVTDAMGRGTLVFTATNPAGPWSDGTVTNISGIDPDIFWDENGDCYATFSGLQLTGKEFGKHLGIQQAKIDLTTGQLLEEPRSIWSGVGGMFPEAPHIYKVDDYYYLFIAEGGTERGHAVAIARSKNINGPFEADPKGILLSNRGTDYKIQNTGHADLVNREDGTWAMVFHGTRPRGASPEWHTIGRETCAVEIIWKDGWPELGEAIEPSTVKPVVEILDDKSTLPEEWISVGSWPLENTEQTPDGIVFNGFVSRRQTTRHFEVVAELIGKGPGGIGVGIDGRHHLGLLRDANRAWVQWTIGDHSFEIGAIDGKVQALKITSEAMKGGFTDPIGPDKLRAYAILDDGSEHELAALDGRYISTEVAGGMTGRVVGVLAFTPQLLKSWRYTSRTE